QRTALVVILDNSVSSGVVVDGRPVLERLRAAARGSLAAAAASDRVWLVLADGGAPAGTREAPLATIDSAGGPPRRPDPTAAGRPAGGGDAAGGRPRGGTGTRGTGIDALDRAAAGGTRVVGR